MSTQLKENPDLQKKFRNVDIQVPKSLVLSTEGFDAFVSDNDLKGAGNLRAQRCGDRRFISKGPISGMAANRP